MTRTEDHSQPTGPGGGRTCGTDLHRRALGLAALGAATSLLTGCLWPRHFDLQWEEEVQLQDGRVIVVTRKTTYERIGTSITQYGGQILTRDTTLTFDAGPPVGVVTQLFKGFFPLFLDQYEGTWYAVLIGGYYYGSRKLPGQDWGELEGPYGQWAIKLDAGKWIPISMCRLPEVFQQPNMLLLYGDAAEHAELDSKRVTLAEKQAWQKRYPPAPPDLRLVRPRLAGGCRNKSGL